MVKTLMWSKTDTIIHTKSPFMGGRHFLAKPRDLCPRLFLLLFGAGVSAVGTTLLQSPGWNERPLGRSPKGQVKLVLCGALQNAVIARH